MRKRLNAVTPLIVRPKRAMQLLSISRSKLDRLIADGELRAKKLGKAVMIETREIERYLESLPVAVLRQQPRRKAS